MAYRDILVHVDDSPTCGHRIAAAVALAKRQGASVSGVAFALDSLIASYVGLEYPASLEDSQQTMLRRSAKSAVDKLARAAENAGVSCRSFVLTSGIVQAPALLSFHARHADLTFMGQPEPDSRGASFQQALLDDVLFASGRPVYIVPYIGRLDVPVRKAVVAWDGGRKAARAVNDAIPLLEGRGGEVAVLVVNPEERRAAHGERPGSDIAAHLERHGIKAKVDVQTNHAVPAHIAILNYLSDAGADLLIMGAYGHSRLRERAFGGVTHALLRSMTTPVLMSE